MGKKGRRNRNKNSTQKAIALAAPVRSRNESSEAIPVSIDVDLLGSLVTDDLLDTVLARGVVDSLNSKEKLKQYFSHLLSAERLLCISVPLLEGLQHGPPSINQRVGDGLPGMEEPFPLLFWASQWKLLNKVGGCSLGDELVDMVLKAGADVNQFLKNKTNALFFAVKYASPETVALLLTAGVNIQQRDHFGRTCLYNALERPSPTIVRRLLEHLPVSETFPSQTPDGTKYQLTPADRVVHSCVSVSPLISWLNLGPPSASDLIESLLVLRQQGAHFSPSGFSPLCILDKFFRDDVVIDPDTVHSRELFVEVAKSLVGARIPESFRSISPESIAVSDTQEEDDDTSVADCSICLEPTRKKVTLYCSHSFCRSCIIDFGQRPNGTCCPLCRYQLCSDIHRRTEKLQPNMDQLLGIENSVHHGPVFMTNEQVVAEARFQGIYSIFSSYDTLRQKLQEEMVKGREVAQRRHTTSFIPTSGFKNGTEAPPSPITAKMGASLSAGIPLISPTEVTMCPREGPVCIEVTVNDIPLLARLSNRSLYTVIGETAVNQLGLKRMEKLQSRKFVDAQSGDKLVGLNITCLEPFVLRLGDVAVTLRNALEASPDPRGEMFGISLGQDFLESGVWCPVDVDTSCDRNSDVGKLVAFLNKPEEQVFFYRVDGELSWPIWEKSTETLRYYAHDGKFAHVPLLHFCPFERTVFMDISLKANVKFDQCFWCCRFFPKGMVFCSTCYEQTGQKITYCDERCQAAAWKIHKRTHKAHHDACE